MSAAETLQDALRQSVDQNHMQVSITDESRTILVALIRDEMRVAVRDGIKEAITKEAAQIFAGVFIDVMKSQASLKVDSWAGNAIKGFASKIWNNVWIIMFACALVYSVGGVPAVVKLLHWAVNEALK